MLTREQVEQLIPHRPPFLLVDEVTALEKDKYITARRTFLKGDPVFAGHFPGHPILPGVLSVEALAQTAAILVNVSQGKTAAESLFFFMAVEKARFRNPVQPGASLTMHVELQQRRGDVYRFAGEVKSEEDTPIAQAVFTAKWAPKEEK